MSSEALEAIRRRHAAPTSGPWDTSRGTLSGYIVQARADVLALLAEVARLEQAATEARYRYQDNLAASFRERDSLAAALAVARKREQRAVSRLEQQLDEAVGRWHETCPHEERSLHEWLGLTWDEYADFVQGGVAALVDEPAAAGAGHNLCACGSTLIVCAKCGDSRCLVCDPYDERDACGAVPARYQGGTEDSASAAADEPATVLACPECGAPLQLGHDCLAAAATLAEPEGACPPETTASTESRPGRSSGSASAAADEPGGTNDRT